MRSIIGGYLKAFLLFLVPLVLVLAALEYLMRSIPNDYSLKHNGLEAIANDVQVLVLGSSPSYDGLDPALFDRIAFNAANISQGYAHDAAILDQHAENLKHLEWIVIDTGYGSFHYDHRTSKESWRAKNYVIYHGLWQFASKPKHTLELLNRPIREQVEMIMAYLKDGTDHVRCGSSGLRAIYPDRVPDLRLDAQETAQRQTKPDTSTVAMNYAHMEDLAHTAKLIGAHILLYTPPAIDAFRKAMDPQQVSQAAAAYSRLVDRFDHVHYADHAQDSIFVEADFFNANHVNAQGAEKLTRSIAEDISVLANARNTASSEAP